MSRLRSPSRRVMSLLIAAPFVVAACTSTTNDNGSATDAPSADAGAPAAESATPEPTAETQATLETAAWLDIELTDAETGKPFTLASLAGNVVAIEPMAIWCSNCKAQQDNVKAAYEDIEAAGVRYISLGIDPGENPASLAKYADRRGYEWTFAQSPIEFSRAMSDLFGQQILSAPSTPLIVLDAEGELVVQDFGFHGPKALLDVLGEAA